jgi:hypothetical protein
MPMPNAISIPAFGNDRSYWRVCAPKCHAHQRMNQQTINNPDVRAMQAASKNPQRQQSLRAGLKIL